MNLWHDMKTRWDKMLPSQPRWDGDRLTFTINTEGKRIPCAISRSALQNLAGHTPLATSDLLGRFMDYRGRIEEIAARIFHITPEWVSGPVSIWADDIDNPPPARVVEVGPKVNGCLQQWNPTSNPSFSSGRRNPRLVSLSKQVNMPCPKMVLANPLSVGSMINPEGSYTVAHLSGLVP